MLSFEQRADHQQTAQLKEQKAGHHRPTAIGITAIVEVLLLVVVILFLLRVSLGEVITGGGKRALKLLIGVARPIEAIEKGMGFQISDIAHAQPLLRIELKQAVDQIGKLRRYSEGVKLTFPVVGNIWVVSSDHVEDHHPQRPKIRTSIYRLVPKLLRRDKGRIENRNYRMPLGMQIGQVRYHGVPVFSDHNIFVINPAVYYLQRMQLLKGKDDPRDNKANVLLQVRTKVCVELRVVRENIEMDVIGEVEVQAEVCIVLVEVDVSDDEGRVVVGGHQILNGHPALERLSSQPLLLHLLHNAGLEVIVLLHEGRTEILGNLVD